MEDLENNREMSEPWAVPSVSHHFKVCTFALWVFLSFGPCETSAYADGADTQHHTSQAKVWQIALEVLGFLFKCCIAGWHISRQTS